MTRDLPVSTLVMRTMGFVFLAIASCGIAYASDSCVPYFDSDPVHSPDQAVYLPANTALSISYSRVTGQEKSSLTIFQNLKTGGWGIIVPTIGDIAATGWGTSIPVGPQPIPPDSEVRYFSATAVFSNPNNGQTYPTAYGRLCTSIDATHNTVTQTYLILTPHVENNDEWANTIVYFNYSPAIPNLEYKTRLKHVPLNVRPKN